MKGVKDTSKMYQIVIMRLNSRKIISILLSLVMIMAYVIPSFAEEVSSKTYTSDQVIEMINKLPKLATIKSADKAVIDEIKAAIASLEKSEQEKIDAQVGRTLETAEWGLKVLEPVNDKTSLSDGTYDDKSLPKLTSSYSKGKSTSGRNRPWSLKNVTVHEGRAVATVMVSGSNTYTYLRTNGKKYEVSRIGEKFCEFDNVPVDLNNTMYIAPYSTAMDTEIAFTITNEIEETVKPSKVKSAYKITANKLNMFKVIDAYTLEKDGENKLYITLSGKGYKELFRGSFEAAEATGDDESKWIKAVPRTDDIEVTFPISNKEIENDRTKDKLEFAIPITENDSYMEIQSRSATYKKWFSRYIKIDQKSKTLEAGNFEKTIDLGITNNSEKIKTSKATMKIVGSKYANDYNAYAEILLSDESFDRVCVGNSDTVKNILKLKELPKEKLNKEQRYLLENLSEIESNKAKILLEKQLGSVKKMDIRSIMEKEEVISFHSKADDKWHEVKCFFSKNNKTLVINEEAPDLQKIPYKIVANHVGMFKVIDAYMVENEGKKILYVTLSGQGYRELLKGTFDEAVATGSDESKWIKGVVRTDDVEVSFPNSNNEEDTAKTKGKLEFAIPVEDADARMEIQALSHSHKKDGFWWYPRVFTIDQKAKTIDVDDYKANLDASLVNNSKQLESKKVSMEIIGGPFSNNYTVTFNLEVNNDEFDRAFIGEAKDVDKSLAAEEEIKAGKRTRENKKLALLLSTKKDNIMPIVAEKQLNSRKDNDMHSILDKETVVSFHSTKENKWHEFKCLISKSNKSFKIDEIVAAEMDDVVVQLENENINKANKTKMIEGLLTYTRGISESLEIRIPNYNPEDLDSVSIDDKLVQRENYSLRKGSIIIALKKDFVDKLSAGKHKIKVYLKNKKKGEGEFRITENNQEEVNSNLQSDNSNSAVIDSKLGENKKAETNKSAKTGDNSSLSLFIGILLAALMICSGIYLRKQK